MIGRINIRPEEPQNKGKPHDRRLCLILGADGGHRRYVGYVGICLDGTVLWVKDEGEISWDSSDVFEMAFLDWRYLTLEESVTFYGEGV